MKKLNDADRLNHILDAIAKIERYLQGFDLQKFQHNEEKIDAVVRNIEIIGEATTCLERFESKISASRMEICNGYSQSSDSRRF